MPLRNIEIIWKSLNTTGTTVRNLKNYEKMALWSLYFYDYIHKITIPLRWKRRRWRWMLTPVKICE